MILFSYHSLILPLNGSRNLDFSLILAFLLNFQYIRWKPTGMAVYFCSRSKTSQEVGNDRLVGIFSRDFDCIALQYNVFAFGSILYSSGYDFIGDCAKYTNQVGGGLQYFAG